MSAFQLHQNRQCMCTTKAIFSCDLRDFQYPFVLRHTVRTIVGIIPDSFGHETRVSRKHSEGLSKY